MRHQQWQGTHFNIGFQQGSLLRARGQSILDHVPFPITEERCRFAEACIPAYQACFPAVLEEIRGLAAGQQCPEELLRAVLFSMYALPPACGCSCLAVSNGREILLGRNSDFLTALEALNTNVIYRPDGAHAFTGNTTAFVEIEDGVNDRGLAAGLTSVYTGDPTPGLNAGMLTRLFLETCGTVEEALALARTLPAASAQTLTLADAAGDIALLEWDTRCLEVLRPAPEAPYVCAVNTFSSAALASGLPEALDDWQAKRRHETLRRALSRSGAELDRRGAQDILSGRKGFLCQYDRAAGRDTVWSVLYDLKRRELWRAEGNPSREVFRRDEHFAF